MEYVQRDNTMALSKTEFESEDNTGNETFPLEQSGENEKRSIYNGVSAPEAPDQVFGGHRVEVIEDAFDLVGSEALRTIKLCWKEPP